MTAMQKCTEKDRTSLLRFLEQEAVYNTFFISDIDHYGFDSEFQSIYAATENDHCLFACLKFHNILILAGQAEYMDIDMLSALAKEGVDVIMGKDALVTALKAPLADTFNYTSKWIYKLTDPRHLPESPHKNIIASVSDGDAIHVFLNTVPEFKGMYASKEMITNRIAGSEGIHIYHQEDRQMVAHGNTAASTDKACFIGGLATHPSYRHQGYATRIVAQLSKDALAKGMYPCLISEMQDENSLFTALGFEAHGKWGTLNRK